MKTVLLLAALVAGSIYGYDFVMSEKFQAYGDKHKAEWTCVVNNFIGNLYVVMSKYKKAENFFAPVVARCPKTSMAEEASFKVASCLEAQGLPNEAIAAYKKYLEAYPTTKRAKLASFAVDRLRGL